MLALAPFTGDWMAEAHYVCDGSCKADISREQHKAGLTRCGAAGCSRFGKPFRKVVERK
jgi:hypothetical protein